MKQKSINKALSQYLKNLDIGDDNRTDLKDARTSIRVHLRENFPVAKEKIKFMTQGSFQYQTINRPCYPPKQQMDLDYGIYVPKSCVETSPEGMLALLAESLCSHELIKNGKWKLNTEKDSCVRIVIAQDKHVDIPLYCAPDEEMDKIKALAVSPNDLVYEIFGTKYSYDRIEGNCVDLAHKVNGWTHSDSRRIRDWFEGNVDKYSRKYIHICRILKAWRDHQWPENDSPLTSILLMRMVDIIFEEMGMTQDWGDLKDDDVLYSVSRKLADTINGPVTDPDPTRNEKLNDFDQEELDLCIIRFNQLQQTLYSVLYEQSTSDRVKELRIEFGNFFPDDPDLCKLLLAAPLIPATAAASPTPRFHGG